MYQILCNLENFKGWSYFDNFDCHPYKFSRWPNTTRSMCSNVSLWEKKINLFSQQATVSLHFLNSMECLYSFALAITYWGCNFACCERIITCQILNDWTPRFPRLHVKTISPVESLWIFSQRRMHHFRNTYIPWICIIKKKTHTQKDVSFEMII